MSRRNSASRRRSYGRRLHEMHERREARRPARVDWADDLDRPLDATSIDQLAYDDWQPQAGGVRLP